MINVSGFTREEKEACLPAIDALVGCCRITRIQGVLALEDFVHRHNNDFLTFAATLVIDGRDPDLVKGMLQTLISADDHTGSALLERLIITEGILNVQAGESPDLLEVKLLSMLGEDFLRQRNLFPVCIKDATALAEQQFAEKLSEEEQQALTWIGDIVAPTEGTS